MDRKGWETRETQLLDIKEFSRTNNDDDDDNADNETNYYENRTLCFVNSCIFTFDISEVKMIQDLMASHS